MPGHPRLYRRGATYYHRAAIPVDIADTYPKTEETFSLKTRDYRDALKLVRIAAVGMARPYSGLSRSCLWTNQNSPMPMAASTA
jgi:hypothetical protein